jgi:hypothetical protein
MLGKTNATTGGSSGGAGDTVTAINKTGSNITTGDKVWLNENAQTAGASFNTLAGSYRDCGFITRTGNNFYDRNKNKFYSVTPSGLTEVLSFNVHTYARLLKYMANGTTFLAPDNTKADSYRIDENAQVTLPEQYFPICDDLFMVYGRDWYLYKLNLDTFKEVKGWYFENNALKSDNIFIIGNKLYVQGKMFELPENGGTIPGGTTGTTVSGLPSSQRYMGVTSDGKYLLTCYSNSLTHGDTLTIHEVVNDTTFRLVQASELPAEFQPFYNGTSKPVCIFNPYTGVLTCVIPQTQQYLVAKYENGSWNVLPITLNHEGNDLQNLTVADDLSRVCYLSGSGSSYKYTIANLETTSGYAAIPYKTYNINDKTLTGVASSNADPDMAFEVAVGGSINEVNNQELTVTDNGVYFPDPSYTGFSKVLVNVEKGSNGDTLLLKNDSGEDLNVGDNVLFNVGGSTSETDVQVKLTTTSTYADKGSIFIDNDNVYVNYSNSDSVYRFVNNYWEHIDRKGWGEARSRGAVIAFPHDRERIAFHRRGSGHSYLLYKNVMFTITDHQYIGRYNGKYYVVSKSDNNIKEYLPETNSIIDIILFNKANDSHTSYIDELTGRGASFDHTGNIDFFQIDENGTFVQTGTVDVILRDSAEIVCFTGVDEGDYLFYGTNYNGKYYSNGGASPSLLKSNLIVYKIVKTDIGEYTAAPINDQLQSFANEDCFVNFDLRNDVLCIGTRKGIFGFDFDRATGKFIPIPLNISLPDNGNEEYPYYFCMSPDKTKAIVTVRTKNDNMNIGLYTIGVKEQCIIKNEFNQYNPSNTFTGVVTSGPNEEGKYEIKCILPQEIELELNTDIDILENEFIIEGGI